MGYIASTPRHIQYQGGRINASGEVLQDSNAVDSVAITGAADVGLPQNSATSKDGDSQDKKAADNFFLQMLQQSHG